MEFRRTSRSRGLSLSSRLGDDLKVCRHGVPGSARQAAEARRQLQGKSVSLVPHALPTEFQLTGKKHLEKIPLRPLNSLSLA